MFAGGEEGEGWFERGAGGEEELVENEEKMILAWLRGGNSHGVELMLGSDGEA
jgi:hypothetical protein